MCRNGAVAGPFLITEDRIVPGDSAYLFSPFRLQVGDLQTGRHYIRVRLRRAAMIAELEAKLVRLALVEQELLQLGARHDLAMSAFKFDEARDVQQRITVLERERAELVAVLPAVAPQPPAAPVLVRVRARPAARLRRRSIF